MRRKGRWILWGRLAKQIRLGWGDTAEECMRDAFGTVAENMIASPPQTLGMVRSMKTRKVVFEQLITSQIKRFEESEHLRDWYSGESTIAELRDILVRKDY